MGDTSGRTGRTERIGVVGDQPAGVSWTVGRPGGRYRPGSVSTTADQDGPIGPVISLSSEGTDTMVVSATGQDTCDAAGGTALRREIVARPNSHVEVVTVPPGGEIGAHVHTGVDETIVIVAGDGQAELDGRRTPLRPGILLFIPDGTPHNITNPGAEPLRLYAVRAGSS